MQNPFQIGDMQTYTHRVTEADLAAFQGQVVHPVYSTFALGRDAEWACRQFVLHMREPGEEGVGARLTVTHKSPALLGEEVTFTATLVEVTDNRVLCTYRACVGTRVVAEGEQLQLILDKARFDAHLESLRTSQ